MKGFLEQVAMYLHRVYHDELNKFCIVFPNIRAGLFFKKYLAQSLDVPVWAPTFRSMESLMEEIACLGKADDLLLIFELFQTFKQHKQTNESFDDFYFWGEMLLNDFDDLDKQLVNARDLFSNVSDLKEIDQLFDYLTEEQKKIINLFWQNFNKGDGVLLKTEFASIWKLLYPVYETFKLRLLEKSLGYEGMIQRHAIKMLKKDAANNLPYEKYVFIGFNALTQCEKQLFNLLKNNKNKALFFWDYDDYYISNQWHEAGAFMRENIQLFPSEWRFDTQNLTCNKKNIEIISLPSETGQTKITGQLLEEICSQKKTKSDLTRTAIVLPDEHLLMPVLSSLPDSDLDINITMGYPFTSSSAYSLFERLSTLQIRARVYADGERFYHKDVSMVLYHPYIQNIIPEEANALIKFIIEHNRIYVSVSELSKNDIIQSIFKRCSNARELSNYFLAIVEKLDVEYAMDNKVKTENWQLKTFRTALQRFHDILIANNIEIDVQIFCRLLRKNFASLKIPFSGEPLKGLQLMGLLETRALDFDNVVILSMNEGVFPKGFQKQSFIPYNLRKGFGLSTSERRDAISAYHFYRLLQRASDVRLLYNSAATDSNTGEMSRFLSQLIYEPAFNVKQKNITFSVNIKSNKPIVKERTCLTQSVLNMYSNDEKDCRFLSPSAISSYIDCPLKFYFRYIEGLKEKDEVADEIDPSMFGKLLHKTMEIIYKPFINKTLNKETIAQIQKNKKSLQNALYRAFAEDYFKVEHVVESDVTGRNIIIREVLLKYVMRILEIDKHTAPFTILSLEKRLTVKFPVQSESMKIMLNMSGYIDRLDSVHNTMRIIDYKTGAVHGNTSTISELFSPARTGNHAVFQTLVYACMTRLSQPVTLPPPVGGGLISCLYVTKELFNEKFDPRIKISSTPIEDYSQVSAEFEYKLNELLSEIFLSDTPFTQTENIKKCRTCPYIDVCNR